MDTRTTDLAKENGSQAGGSEGARRASEELPAAGDRCPGPGGGRSRQAAPVLAGVQASDRACGRTRARPPGEVGALLRREGLYSSHLSHWRRELEALDNGALSAKRRGPKPDADKAHTRRVEGLERDMERLRHKLERAEQIIDAAKKTLRGAGLTDGGGAPAMSTAVELAPLVGIVLACLSLGVSRATYYRLHRGAAMAYTRLPRAPSSLALSGRERQAILDVFHAPEHLDSSPRTVLRESCSTPGTTWARCRRCTGCCVMSLRRAPGAPSAPIRLMPSRSCWPPVRGSFGRGISLSSRGPAKWVHYHLYVILDVFSRYVVGWMLADRESAQLAHDLISATCDKEGQSLQASSPCTPIAAPRCAPSRWRCCLPISGSPRPTRVPG